MSYGAKLELFKGIPLNIGNEDTIYFASRLEQNNYFGNYLAWSFKADDFKFIREAGYVKVNRTHDYLENCNYLRYMNDVEDDPQVIHKWYYAFITGIEYINDTTTGIYFEIDPLQTWLPITDYRLNDCFIERQHATSDNIGDNVATETVKAFKNRTYEEVIKNVLSEGIYVAVLFTWQESYFSTQLAIYPTTYGGRQYSTNLGTVKVDGTVTGSTILLFKVRNQTGELNEDGLQSLRKAIRKTNTLTGRDYVDIETVTNVYIVPASMLNENVLVDISCGEVGEELWVAQTVPTRYSSDGGNTWYDYPTGTSSILVRPEFSLTSFGRTGGVEYTPKNKKLLTSQYTTYQIVNTDGNIAVYEPEGFTGRNIVTDVEEIMSPDFTIMSSILPPEKAVISCTSTLVDKYYGSTTPNEQLFPCGELPSVTINIDTYKDWLARQFVQKIQTVAPLALGAIGGYNEAISGAIAQGSSDLSRTGKPLYGAAKQAHINKTVDSAKTAYLQSRFDKDFPMAGLTNAIRTANDVITTERPVPICAGNGTNLGSTLVAKGIFNLSFRKVAPIVSELQRIDNYFTAYGYAINAIARPKIKVRQRFTYIKTRGARNVSVADTGNMFGIPAEYMEAINTAFDRGIRFWNSTSDMNDLTSENAILPVSEQV